MVIEIAGGEGQNFESRELLKRNKELDDAIVSVREDVANMQENIEELSNELDIANASLDNLRGRLSLKNGAYGVDSGIYSGSYSNYVCTADKLPIKPFQTIDVRLSSVVSSVIVLFYDISGNFISGQNVTKSGVSDFSVQAPSNAYYYNIDIEGVTDTSYIAYSSYDVATQVSKLKADLATQFESGYFATSDLTSCVLSVIARLKDGQSTTFSFTFEGHNYFYGFVSKIKDNAVGGMMVDGSGGVYKIFGSINELYVNKLSV